MGVCASSQYYTSKEYGSLNWPHTTKIIHLDGSLQELRHTVKASQILTQNPNTFLCSSESMYIDKLATQIPSEEDLQLGQIYFLIPISQSKAPFSLQDLCSLAIKASTALSLAKKRSAGTLPVKGFGHFRAESEAQTPGCRKVSIEL
ncbi:uncharacterized protein LOC112489144 [Ziziphus jujuba]|uniref:Uncharacterized protein LOC112489144 n=1 Tax=Ziziphus jujuba TaxID=326968 RepID=A0A6P6FND9_ZIZJJ|nr:uncharacterized protein LOC112489144 [Ziziphus jujuba]